MSIAAFIIRGIVGIGTTLISGKMQSDILKEGQKEDREKWRTELEQAKGTQKYERQIASKQLAESKRQFNVSSALQKESLGLQREGMAREAFQNQVSTLTRVLDKNEQLKNLLFNRMSAFRR